MTDLTLESLERDITAMMTAPENITLNPTKLIVPRSTLRYLMLRPRISKAGSIRKRKRALYWRGLSLWQKMQ